MNPGGPGAPGIPIVEDAEAYFTEELLDRFDIVGWDPRGTGDSTAIDCGDELDYFFATDKSPDDEQEVQENLAAARRFAGDCETRSGDLLANLSSSATVDDMDAIRAALGEEKLTYLGFSYGTYLGAQYADRYPQNVRALVLDGAVDPSLPYEQYTREQAEGFDSALRAFLDDCARDDCGFGGSDPQRAYDRLIAQIDAETVPGEIDGETRELGPGEADLGVASALYAGTDGWDILADALRDDRARRRDNPPPPQRHLHRPPDGRGLRQLAACVLRHRMHRRARAVGRRAARRRRTNRTGCARVRCVDHVAVVAVLGVAGSAGRRAGAGARRRVRRRSWCSARRTTLRPRCVGPKGSRPNSSPARLVVFEGEGHTAFNRGSDCVDDAVERYLVDLEPPADGLEC